MNELEIQINSLPVDFRNTARRYVAVWSVSLQRAYLHHRDSRIHNFYMKRGLMAQMAYYRCLMVYGPRYYRGTALGQFNAVRLNLNMPLLSLDNLILYK